MSHVPLQHRLESWVEEPVLLRIIGKDQASTSRETNVRSQFRGVSHLAPRSLVTNAPRHFVVDHLHVGDAVGYENRLLYFSRRICRARQSNHAVVSMHFDDASPHQMPTNCSRWKLVQGRLSQAKGRANDC